MQHFAEPNTYEARFDEAENDIYCEVEKANHFKEIKKWFLLHIF